MKFTFLLFISLILGNTPILCQDPVSSPEEYDSLYAINIQLSRINGVYIPKDLAEAHERIQTLTPEATLIDFGLQDEKSVCSKLHFGIGRWMILNWNFYEGSRLSHHLKEKGLLHPDDMAQFILRTLHRRLNAKELDQDSIIEELRESRFKEIKEVYMDGKN